MKYCELSDMESSKGRDSKEAPGFLPFTSGQRHWTLRWEAWGAGSAKTLGVDDAPWFTISCRMCLWWGDMGGWLGRTGMQQRAQH